MKTAAKCLRDIAVRRVAKMLGDLDDPVDHADDIVDVVLEVLLEPDREMIAAGRAQLDQAIPKSSGLEFQRNLAALIYRAMLARAER